MSIKLESHVLQFLAEKIRSNVAGLGFSDVQVQNFGTSRDIMIRLPAQKGVSSAQQSDKVLASLKAQDPGVTLKRTEFVGLFAESAGRVQVRHVVLARRLQVHEHRGRVAQLVQARERDRHADATHAPIPAVTVAATLVMFGASHGRRSQGRTTKELPKHFRGGGRRDAPGSPRPAA
mgnify:CR=1 FL=1